MTPEEMEIVKSLRRYPHSMRMVRAADLIERQASDRAEMERALEPFAKVADLYDESEEGDHEVWFDRSTSSLGVPAETFLLRNYRAARQALASLKGAYGTAELAVGQFVYRRIEKLMDAKPGTPAANELRYLTHIVNDVEEYGAQGDEDREWEPLQ